MLEFNEKDYISIVYVNLIHKSMPFGSDGFIESSILGPDVIFDTKNISSSHLLEKYNLKISMVKEIFSMRSPSCYQKLYNNPFQKFNTFKIRPRMKLNTSKLRTLYVKHLRHTPPNTGFEFPYPIGKIKDPPRVTFAFLEFKDASSLIKRSSIHTQEYISLFDDLNTSKNSLQIYYVSSIGISIEELCPMHYNEITRKTKSRITHSLPAIWQRKDFMHALWIPCDTIHVHDPATFKKK